MPMHPILALKAKYFITVSRCEESGMLAGTSIDNTGRREISAASKIHSRHTLNSIWKQAGLSGIER